MPRLALGLVLALVACGGGQRGPAAPDFDLEAPPHVATPTPPTTQPPGDEPTGAPATAATTPAPTAAPPVPTAPPVPPPPNTGTIAKLAWPAATKSFAMRRDAHAYTAPDLKSEPLGKIVEGTRLPVGEAVDGDKRCKVWLAAAPRGWVCARHAAASTKEPQAIVLPQVPAGLLVPQDYYSVNKGAARYATEDAVRVGTPLPEPKHQSNYMVTRDADSIVDIDGTDYVKTSVGIVAVKDLTKFQPSKFTGVDLVATPPPSWP
jgi:hypothetical protein